MPPFGSQFRASTGVKLVAGGDTLAVRAQVRSVESFHGTPQRAGVPHF
jgi:hypothetical protein